MGGLCERGYVEWRGEDRPSFRRRYLLDCVTFGFEKKTHFSSTAQTPKKGVEQTVRVALRFRLPTSAKAVRKGAVRCGQDTAVLSTSRCSLETKTAFWVWKKKQETT